MCLQSGRILDAGILIVKVLFDLIIFTVFDILHMH